MVLFLSCQLLAGITFPVSVVPVIVSLYLFKCGYSTNYCSEWVESVVFFTLPVYNASLYDSLFFTVFNSFDSYDITPAILSLILSLSTLSS